MRKRLPRREHRYARIGDKFRQGCRHIFSLTSRGRDDDERAAPSSQQSNHQRVHWLRGLDHAGPLCRGNLKHLNESITFGKNAQETGQAQDASFMAVMSSSVIDGWLTMKSVTYGGV